MTKAKAKSPDHKDTTIPTTLIDELLQGCPPLATQEDLFGPDGVIKQLSKALVERCLEVELSTHLGYEKHERGTEEKTNGRNGFSRKMLKSEQGPVDLAIARDREGSYDPLLVKKHQTSLTGFYEIMLCLWLASQAGSLAFLAVLSVLYFDFGSPLPLILLLTFMPAIVLDLTEPS